MRSQYDDCTDELDDDELLARESVDRHEYHRLQREQPGLRDATFGVRQFSGELIRAWERWRRTSSALQLRGLGV